ncbi:conserved hypothetical protein (plasmid) [Borreliella burgdorferi WI91-23]|nr:conserved hypothetical protein [Borreliella burgdorferi 64b]ACN55688.1 conserved hypothetical protein [Borreliella burgdorferi WI91-23]
MLLILHLLLMNLFELAFIFASNKKGSEVDTMITAIDKLITIYKKVKS